MTRRVNSPVNPSSRSFRAKSGFLILGIGNLAGLGEEAGGRHYLDPSIGMNDAGSKGDGGNVTFPSGAQAENESQSAGRQISLIGVRNDGRIEERSGFQGIFGQEIGADQEASLFGKLRVREQHLAYLLKTLQKQSVYLLMTVAELGKDFIQERTDALFWK